MDFYTSRPKLLFVQIFFLLIIIFFLMVSRTIIGILLSLFFGFLIVKTLPDQFAVAPQVSFNDQGIQTSNDRFGLILWDDIVQISVSQIRVASFWFNRFLAIQVQNPDKYRSRIIAKKGALFAPLFVDPAPYISVSFSLLTPSLDEAVEYLRSRRSDKLARDVAKN